jgi:hypothetical protein
MVSHERRRRHGSEPVHGPCGREPRANGVHSDAGVVHEGRQQQLKPGQDVRAQPPIAEGPLYDAARREVRTQGQLLRAAVSVETNGAIRTLQRQRGGGVREER